MDSSPPPKPGNGDGHSTTQPGNGKPPGKSGGLSLQTAAIGLVLLIVLFGGYVAYTLREKSRLETAAERDRARAAQAEAETARIQKEADLRQARAQADARLALAASRQNEVLQRTRNVTNALGTLVREVAKVIADAESLATNASGQRVAQHPDLVALARRFYENDLRELPDRDEILIKMENARRIQQQVMEQAGTAYDPPADLSVSLQDYALWADHSARKVGQLQKTLASLAREATIKAAPGPIEAQTPTLEASIRNLTLGESASRQRIMVAATTEADQTAAAKLAAAEAERIIREAQEKADRMLKESENAAAKTKREIEAMTAQAKIEQAKAEVAKQAKEDEARNVTLRAKASEPAVKALLAPFLAAGRWRPKGDTYDKKPQSLTALKSWGALEQTAIGLQKLIDCACTPLDKERPRWGFGGNYKTYRLPPEYLDQATEAQKLLIELGPVLVELGMLEP